MTPHVPARGPQCLPVGALERIAAGEGTPPEHIATCADCRGFVELLKTEAEAYARSHSPELFLAQLERRAQHQPRRSWWLGVVGAALAASLAVAVWNAARVEPGVHFKGASFTLHLHRDGQTRLLGPNETLHPGDSLRFTVRSEFDGYAAVLERDGAGSATVVAPFGAKEPIAVGAGSTTLPDSAVLDAASGAEWLVAVVAPTRFDLNRLRTQWDAQPIDQPPRWDCAGCTIDARRFDKQP